MKCGRYRTGSTNMNRHPMHHRSRLQSVQALLFSVACLLTSTAYAKNPNIILAMADDMGWHDLSTYGNDRVKPPNIDRLAKEGMKMTQFSFRKSPQLNE